MILLVLLFALGGFCNGMIDVMDKQFQEEPHLSLAQSAWMQFAPHLGYLRPAHPGPGRPDLVHDQLGRPDPLVNGREIDVLIA